MKTDGLEGKGSAHLWFRVDRANQSVGFFDNMGNRPIVGKAWQRYEIVGDVAADATGLVFGFLLIGRGRAWFDHAQLFYQQDGQWVEIPLPDGDFESSVSNTQTGANQPKVVKGEASSGQQSLLIERNQGNPELARKLFDRIPKPGEVAKKTLIPGLHVDFPLVLPRAGLKANAQHDADLGALLKAVENVSNGSADQEAVRLGNIVILWNVFQHFYPYFDEGKIDWDGALAETLQRGLNDTTTLGHVVTLKKMVAKLRDGHGVVYHNDPQNGDLPARFDWIENQLVVTATQDDKLFQRGDVIQKVNGISGPELLREAESMVSGSDQLRRHRGLNVVGFGPMDEPVRIELTRGGANLKIEAKRVKAFGNVFFKQLYEFSHPAFKDFGNGCYYLNEWGLEKEKFQELLPLLAKAKGIIVDQRFSSASAKDPFDLMALIPHLAKEAYTSARWNVPRIVYPDRENLTYSESRWPSTPPSAPHISARVLIINVPSVVSYGESIMGIFEHYKLAEFVGEATAGCNGNANFISLPGGIRVMWTGMKVLKHDGSQHHLIGIQPTYPVKRTLKAVVEGRDEYLEKAMELLGVK